MRYLNAGLALGPQITLTVMLLREDNFYSGSGESHLVMRYADIREK